MTSNSLKHKIYIMTIIAIYILLDSLFSLIVGYKITLEVGLFRIGILIILDLIPDKYYLKSYIKFLSFEDKIFKFFSKKEKEGCEA